MPVRGKRAERPKGHRTKASRSVSMKGGEPRQPRQPRQRRLPTMDDNRLDELHGLAESYVDIRDQRIQLNAKEKPLKESLLSAMKRHGKTHYKCNGLEIDVVHENEKVRVKLHKATEEGEESEAASA